ncbi:MFS transporter [Ferrimonas pelagia]|uniref:MFS transporter n=1 Tax=Ferrimonas pelagia TaxID=1177826 RepID=A0ABP9FCR6_9GAMM
MHSRAVDRVRTGIFVPVAGLVLFAVAAGYFMSLLPLALPSVGLPPSLAAGLASLFYAGLLLGALRIEPVVRLLGHRRALILFLSLLLLTVVLMALLPMASAWLLLRFVAGVATAGVFVVIESWLLLVDDDRLRSRRLGLYMMALYGGNALGQLLLSGSGVSGVLPFAVVSALLVAAILPPLLVRQGAPRLAHHQRIPLRAVKQLNRPALVGCLVSGLLLGPLYGLMPLYLDGHALWQAHTGPLMASLILGGMAIQPLASYLAPRMSRSLLMALLSFLGIMALAGVQRGDSLWFVVLSMAGVGAASFALYPVAIAKACVDQPTEKIVSITELMLLSYSVGAVLGLLLTSGLARLDRELDLLAYLAMILLITTGYMLMRAAKGTVVLVNNGLPVPPEHDKRSTAGD